MMSTDFKEGVLNEMSVTASSSADFLDIADRHRELCEWGRPRDIDFDAQLPQPDLDALAPFMDCCKVTLTLGKVVSERLSRQAEATAYDNISAYIGELVRRETRILAATQRFSQALEGEIDALKNGRDEFGNDIAEAKITISLTPKVSYWLCTLIDQASLPSVGRGRVSKLLPNASLFMRALISAEENKPAYARAKAGVEMLAGFER